MDRKVRGGSTPLRRIGESPATAGVSLVIRFEPLTSCDVDGCEALVEPGVGGDSAEQGTKEKFGSSIYAKQAHRIEPHIAGGAREARGGDRSGEVE